MAMASEVSPPAKDDDIVSAPHNTGSQPLLKVTPFPYPVEYMQVEIGQQR